MKRFLISALVTMIILLVLFVIAAYAEVKGNMKYEVIGERISVTCVDHSTPVVRIVARPTGGIWVVVVCEGQNSKISGGKQ